MKKTKLFNKRCKALRDKAKELNRNWLYSWEAADAIGVYISNMPGYYRTMCNRKADIPKVVFSEPGKKNVRRPPNTDVEMPEKTDRGYYYPAGLQVASVRKLTDGRIVYMLK